MDAVLQQQLAALVPNAQPASEYTGVQQFIFDEMVRNSASPTVTAIKIANLTPLGKPTAYALWAEKVGPGRDWDHKLDILDQTAGENEFTPLPGGNGNIRFDAWSNIHYGFVGIEAGFTPAELRGGAFAADLADRMEIDPGDDVAVRIGIELRQQYAPDELRPEHINEAIERYRAELEQTGMIGPNLK